MAASTDLARLSRHPTTGCQVKLRPTQTCNIKNCCLLSGLCPPGNPLQPTHLTPGGLDDTAENSVAFCEGYNRARHEVLDINILNIEELRKMVFHDLLTFVKRNQ